MSRGAVAATMLALLAAAPARAGERQFDLTGPSLRLLPSCAREVIVTPSTIVPDGHVRIVADSDVQSDLDRLSGVAGAPVVLQATSECPSSSGPRHLHIRITTSPGMAIGIAGGGSETYQLGAFASPLNVDTSGATDIAAESVTALDMTSRGSGDLRIGTVNGAVTIVSMGAADIDLQHVAAPVFSYTARGSGNLVIGAIKGDRASIATSGSSDVKIGTVDIDALALKIAGSGDFALPEGRIGSADIGITGMADVSIAARIASARLVHRGMSDVDLPNVAHWEAGGP